jgi:hypothetical protein
MLCSVSSLYHARGTMLRPIDATRWHSTSASHSFTPVDGATLREDSR